MGASVDAMYCQVCSSMVAFGGGKCILEFCEKVLHLLSATSCYSGTDPVHQFLKMFWKWSIPWHSFSFFFSSTWTSTTSTGSHIPTNVSL